MGGDFGGGLRLGGEEGREANEGPYRAWEEVAHSLHYCESGVPVSVPCSGLRSNANTEMFCQ